MALRLIRAGADVNARDRTGMTPLHQCITNTDNDNLINLLLDNGADPNIKDNNGLNVYFKSPPKIKDLLGSFDQRRALEERKLLRKAVGGSFRQC